MTDRDTAHSLHLNRISRILDECPRTAGIMACDFMRDECATASDANFALALTLSQAASRIIAARAVIVDLRNWQRA